MQVTETSAEGLTRELKIVVPAATIDDTVASRLKEIGQTVKMPGFRPGKVPLSVLRKRYGASLLGEVLEETVQDTTNSVLEERSLRPASKPKVEIVSFDEGSDLEYTIRLDILPEVPRADLSGITLTRPVATVSDEEVQEALDRVASEQDETAPLEENRPAADGDVAVIDFIGRKDGEAFEGGTASDFPLTLGSGTFIPGFEEQVTGMSVGDTRNIDITFPEDYGHEDLDGQAVTFEVTLKELRQPVTPALDDALASKLGFESLDKMRDAAREQLQGQRDRYSRLHVKRRLFDHLDSNLDFEVPPSLLESEFNGIWEQHQEDKENGALSAEDAAKDEATLRAEYEAIAKRRVKLGLLLSDIGTTNNIAVTEDELKRAVLDITRRYPGQEQQVIRYYTRDPEAMNELRAPVFEDKVVDFILELATVEDQPVSSEELFRDPDAEESA